MAVRRSGRGSVAPAGLKRPRALRPGDRLAVVAPASPCAEDAVRRGARELETLGFNVPIDERVFAQAGGYLAGEAALRAAHLQEAFADPAVAGIVCVRGGYGSAQILPLLDAAAIAASPKVFVGYSDITAIHTFLQQQAGLVTFHGPMLEGRFADPARYDRDSFVRAVCGTEPMGAIVPPLLEVWRAGEASGVLVGGTITQLASSLGTPWAFDPPPGCVLFFDEVNERPYRLDRLLTQLVQAGIIGRASAIVFNELPGCDEPGGEVRGVDAVRRVLDGFSGPIVGGFPSGHTPGATVTLPFGVQATVVARGRAALVIDEPAVEG
ncbi:MAG: LD-carboxypeptidase [Vicinamibacteraceae bacterium]